MYAATHHTELQFVYSNLQKGNTHNDLVLRAFHEFTLGDPSELPDIVTTVETGQVQGRNGFGRSVRELLASEGYAAATDGTIYSGLQTDIFYRTDTMILRAPPVIIPFPFHGVQLNHCKVDAEFLHKKSGKIVPVGSAHVVPGFGWPVLSGQRIRYWSQILADNADSQGILLGDFYPASLLEIAVLQQLATQQNQTAQALGEYDPNHFELTLWLRKYGSRMPQIVSALLPLIDRFTSPHHRDFLIYDSERWKIIPDSLKTVTIQTDHPAARVSMVLAR